MNTEQMNLFASPQPVIKPAAQRRALREEMASAESELAERLQRRKIDVEYLWLGGIGKTGECAKIWANIDQEYRTGNASLRLRIKAAKEACARLRKPRSSP